MAKTRINDLGSSNEFIQGALGTLRKRFHSNKLVLSPILDSGPFVKNSPQTSSSSSNSLTPTSSSGFATVTVTPTSSLVGSTVNDAKTHISQHSTGNSDSSIFVAIGLIVGITVIGCAFACLYRRRRERKVTTTRSFWDASVGSGSGATSRKHLEINEGKLGSTPVTEYHTKGSGTTNKFFTDDSRITKKDYGTTSKFFTDDSRITKKDYGTTGEEIVNVGIAPGLQEGTSFGKMKLPPTTALPPLPKEARLPPTIHCRSMSSPNMNTNMDFNTPINEIGRAKSLGQKVLPKSKFNFPPPPRYPPNFPFPTTSHHLTITNSSSHGSEYASTSSILNDHVIRVTPPLKRLDSLTKLDVHEKNVYNDNGEKNRGGEFLTPLPKVETINSNLSINFEQLSIFKDKTTPHKEYPVGVGEKGDLGNRETAELSKLDEGENLKILLVNNNNNKLYNEYI